MKILWFTDTLSLYEKSQHHYRGCGWIDSLETLVRQHNEIELAVSFFHPIDEGRVVKKDKIYYPIHRRSSKKSLFQTIINNLRGKIEDDRKYLSKIIEVINDFKPDLIQVFGTEGNFGNIKNHINVPMVIHMQGLINPYLNTYFPPFISKISFLFSPYYFWKNLIGASPYFGMKIFEKQAKREKQYFKQADYLIGRTHWDRDVSSLLSPKAQYFHVDEVLRPIFYEEKKEKYRKEQTIKIVSTLSPTIYKGIDVVLKAACLLKKETNIFFEWRIVGISENDNLLKHFEKIFKISHKHNNIICLGKQSAEKLVRILKNSDLCIQPSYIDNSPNSVCEAQILGLPVIACNVGGVSTLIKDGETGVLVPSNGVYELACTIRDYGTNSEKYFEIGKKARIIAQQRHDRENIVKSLFEVYNEIIGD